MERQKLYEDISRRTGGKAGQSSAHGKNECKYKCLSASMLPTYFHHSFPAFL